MTIHSQSLIKNTAILLTITFAILMMSCSSDDMPNFRSEFRAIDSIVIPDTVTLNKDYKFEIYYEKKSACDEFNGFNIQPDNSEDAPENAYSIAVIANVYNDTECDIFETPEIKMEEMRFRADQKEPYNFLFWKGNDANEEPLFIEKTIFVKDTLNQENVEK